MVQRGIEPEKVTKPIQLVAAWFVALVLLVGAFLGAANTVKHPAWLPILYGINAVLMVPFFAWLVFRLQTRYRPELLEDVYYSKYRVEQAVLAGFQPENVLSAEGKTIEKSTVEDPADLTNLRANIYQERRGLFLVHTWRPSQVPGQVADISVRLHEQGREWKTLSKGEVDRVVYYLGPRFFAGRAVVKTNASESFRLDISAYGSTECVAQVFFKGGASVTMDRYLDLAS